MHVSREARTIRRKTPQDLEWETYVREPMREIVETLSLNNYQIDDEGRAMGYDHLDAPFIIRRFCFRQNPDFLQNPDTPLENTIVADIDANVFTLKKSSERTPLTPDVFFDVTNDIARGLLTAVDLQRWCKPKSEYSQKAQAIIEKDPLLKDLNVYSNHLLTQAQDELSIAQFDRLIRRFVAHCRFQNILSKDDNKGERYRIENLKEKIWALTGALYENPHHYRAFWELRAIGYRNKHEDVSIAYATHEGTREENQDGIGLFVAGYDEKVPKSSVYTRSLGTVVLADGVGSTRGGIARDKLLQLLQGKNTYDQQTVEDALGEVNEELNRMKYNIPPMTTVAAVSLGIAYPNKWNEPKRITLDESVLKLENISVGDVGIKRIRTIFPGRYSVKTANELEGFENFLRNAVGASPKLYINEKNKNMLELIPGDTLLLYSDGLRFLTDAEITSILSLDDCTLQEKLDTMVEGAKEKAIAKEGVSDNITVIAITPERMLTFIGGEHSHLRWSRESTIDAIFKRK